MGRADVIIVSQFGVETAPGVAVPANKIFPTVSLMPKLRRNTKQFRAQGDKYNTSSVKTTQYAEGTYDGVLDYNSLIYVLAGLFPVPTPTAIPLSTTGKKWDFLPLTRQLDNPKTYTIEVGDATSVDKYANCQFTSLTIQWGQEDMKINGDLLGQTMTQGTQTPAAVMLPERPVERGQINVYHDTIFANLGTTQVTDPFEEQLQLGVKFKPKFVHNSTYQSFKETIEVAPSLVFSYLQEYNSQARAMMSEMIASDQLQYIRVKAEGLDLSTLQDGSVKEMIQVDIAGKYTEPEEVRDALNGGVYAYRYHFVALDNPLMGRPFHFICNSTQASL
jgi:hypothetical protein